MLSNHPISVQCDNEKGFITYSATLTVACSFGVRVWVYSLISSPSPTYFVCVCVCLTNKKKKKKRKKLSVVKLSHISKVWYWEGIYYLLPDTNYRIQFWGWNVSVLPYLIPLPRYICVSVCGYQRKRKKILGVVKSSYIGNVWYWVGVNHLLRDTNCCMQFWCCLVSLVSYLIPLPRYSLFVCVC